MKRLVLALIAAVALLAGCAAPPGVLYLTDGGVVHCGHLRIETTFGGSLAEFVCDGRQFVPSAVKTWTGGVE